MSVIGVVLLAAPAMGATGQNNGCSLQGSWMGTGNIQLLTTYNGQSVSSGTIIGELPGFDPTLGGTFPNAVTLTSLRGVWERTGGNTFVYSQVGYALDATGKIVWIGKNSGNKLLTEDCNLMKIESTLAVSSPDGTPLFCAPVETIYLHRITIDPPCQLDQ